jgi:hypothetical protein
MISSTVVKKSEHKTSMKTRTALPFPIVILGATASLASSAFSQTWETIDDFQYVAGQQAVNLGLAVAPSGTLFASGWAYDDVAGVGHGLVMASSDSGNTWSAPLDDFVYPGESNTRYDGGIVADSSGNLYVAGRAYGSSPGFHRIVRRSADGGATWSTVDDVVLSSYLFPVAASAITADNGGNVYVTQPNGWTIRKGVGGTTFSTVDSLSGNGNAVFAHPTLGVFAAGSSGGAWVVRRSLNGGGTWATVDTYGAGSAFGIRADAKANLYVLGWNPVKSKQSNTLHWIIRRSSDGGNSWQTADDFLLAANLNCRAVGFAADTHGNLFVAGCANPGFTPTHWIVRENPGGTGGWTTVDDFTYSSNAQANTIAADGLGNVFVGGQGSPSTGALHWLVRRN